MTKNKNESDLVKQLRERIKTLEIDQERANQRIEELERITNQAEDTSSTYTSTTLDQSNEASARHKRRTTCSSVQCNRRAAKNKHTREGCPELIRVDCRGDPLHIGDKIYIKTRGRNPERHCIITGFDCQWALILDRTNQEQKRLPRNVELRVWN